MPDKELLRLQAVKRFIKLELSSKKQIQEVLELAAEICEVPIVLITLLDEQVQYFKAKMGLDTTQTPVEAAFCRYAIREDNDVMIIPDSLEDIRFVNNPLVTGAPNIRFYAGAPLETQDGHKLGTLCAIDRKPKDFTERQKQMLVILSRQVINIMELESTIEALKEQYAEEQLVAMKLQSFFESGGTAHVLIGRDGRVMVYNKAAKDNVLHFNGKIIQTGEPLIDFVSEGFKAFFLSHFCECLLGKDVFEEACFEYGEGIKQWWEISMDPLYNLGIITGVSLNMHNISDRKRHEEMILRQNERLQQIAHMQSHDFQRPIANITGLMDLIKHNDYENCNEYLKMMEKAVDELNVQNREVVALCNSLQ